MVLKTKIANYKRYLINDKELEEVRKRGIESFISLFKAKYSNFNIDKILEESTLQFSDVRFIIERTINRIIFRMQKKLIKYAKIVKPSEYFLLKYFLLYLKLNDIKLIISFHHKNLNEEEKRKIGAYIVSDNLLRLLSKSEFDNFISKFGIKGNDEIEKVNELTYFILKKLKLYGKKNRIIDLIIANYNYNLEQKEKMLKIDLNKYKLGNKKINNKAFYEKIKKLMKIGNDFESLLAFLIYLEEERKKILRVVHSF